ncbi:hypothetical protein FMUND_15483 [Fusarium mundagurra]|uniref:Uncharacterized protein n=2 Tax=Fusarium TaxID=5506 RepID=A0A8H5XPR0_9HYPO|nr:hypothetical protein FBEOM_6570 [Fusarium beomiforme]KAF5697232.1 hypothetical protein FMUND_15483 [Fusarium mundagurra]
MPQKSLSLDQIVEKLIETSKIVENRMGLKSQEEARVKDAFSLLASRRCSVKKKPYLELLQRVHKRIGGYGVVLCAAIGPTMILAMKDRDRVNLVVRMEEESGAIEQGELRKLANQYTEKCEVPSTAADFSN